MAKLATIAIVLVVGIAAVLYPARDAHACFVRRGPDPDRGAIARADIAFIGRSIAERSLGPDDTWPHESTIVVVSVIKGNISGEVVLSPLPFHESDCSRGSRLPVGTTALVLMDSSYEPGRPFGLDVYDFDSMTKDAALPTRTLVLIVVVAAATLVGCLAQVWVARQQS